MVYWHIGELEFRKEKKVNLAFKPAIGGSILCFLQPWVAGKKMALFPHQYIQY